MLVWNIRCTNMDLSKYRRMTRLAMRACAVLSRYPYMIIANSQAAIEYHQRRHYRPERSTVIPNGFDLDHFKPDPALRTQVRRELGIPDGASCIGLVARFDPMKDHKTFLRAAGKVGAKYPGAHFVLAGHGVDSNNRTLCQWIKEARLNSRVHLLGQQQEIQIILAGLDIACSSSSYGEGFSNSIGEAMSCGVPCVVTDVGDSARIVGKTGKVVPPRSPHALAEAILELLELSPEERKKLRKLARERIRRHYSLDKIVAGYERLYMSIAAR